MNAPPINAKFPLIVVKRVYYDAFLAGEKTIEYRRHRAPFTMRAFYPGRWVRIAYNYDLARYPHLLARVVAFSVAPAREHPELATLYKGLGPDDEIALISLAIDDRSEKRRAERREARGALNSTP